MSEQVWSSDEENYCHQSLGYLLDNDDEIVEGSIVHVGDAEKPTAAELIDASDVIELLACRGGDLGGEWAEDYPDVTKEAEAELETFLHAWIEKHCAPEFWRVSNSKEYTVTAEDIALHRGEPQQVTVTPAQGE